MTEARTLWLPGALAAMYAAAVALARGPAQWVLAAPLLIAPLSLWVLRSPNAWLILFFAAALLAPPLPAGPGNSGPHPSIVFAAIGGVIGLLRLGEWRFQRGLLPGALVLFFTVLVVSLAPAALYSGPEIALQSLARVALAGISAYVFFYVSAGPGRAGGVSRKLLYGCAVAAAAFACLDFYYQFPAPAGFGPQFIWLDTGIYRRAQGLFYEASTLGNFCAFFLLMTVIALVRRTGSRMALLAGGVILATALMFSYSRSSVANLVVALAALAVIERARPAVRWMAVWIAAALAAFVVVLFQAFPSYAELYWVRLWKSFSTNESVLSGRAESWRTLLEFLREHPWHAIFGVGYKTLPYSDFIGRPVVADNMYLSILIETGLVGLAAMLLLNLAILRAGYIAARRGDEEHSFYGTWIFCFWSGQVVQMLSVDLLTFWRVLPVYLWVLAMAVRK